jgi:hypothetical protein
MKQSLEDPASFDAFQEIARALSETKGDGGKPAGPT